MPNQSVILDTFSDTEKLVEKQDDQYAFEISATPIDCDGSLGNPCSGFVVYARPIVGRGQDKDEYCSGGMLIDDKGRKGAMSSSDMGYFSSKTTIKECWGM